MAGGRRTEAMLVIETLMHMFSPLLNHKCIESFRNVQVDSMLFGRVNAPQPSIQVSSHSIQFLGLLNH